jgi:hypothetical protein
MKGLIMRNRSVKSVKEELIKKSREAILAAVQIYNNPQITFKAESFITLSIIAWTYLMHSYYRDQGIDYCYFDIKGVRKHYHKTKNGAKKHWELERCINCDECPLDSNTKNNLRFLIGVRHEIEHQMTSSIDEFISAKLQACAINYDYYIKNFFGNKYSVSKELALSIQFSAVSPEQEHQLRNDQKLTSNVKNFISSFEKSLSDDDIKDSRYAYRLLYVPYNAKTTGQADRVVKFVKPDSELAGEIERVLIKETEKSKYIPSQIVDLMKNEGYSKFNMHKHSELWKLLDGKNPNNHFGTKIAKVWYWYDSWITVVKKHCEENKERYI